MITKESVLKKLAPVQTVVLATASDDYKLIYNYHMMKSSENRFVFYGIHPKSKCGISELLYSSPSIDAVLAYIEKTYPLMKSEDWKELDALLENAKAATRACGIAQNKDTVDAEDMAYKKFAVFCKKHGLWE